MAFFIPGKRASPLAKSEISAKYKSSCCLTEGPSTSFKLPTFIRKKKFNCLQNMLSMHGGKFVKIYNHTIFAGLDSVEVLENQPVI